MTPQEREQVANLFDRLTQLEKGTRDPDAEQTIAEGLKRAPNAIYALVQTVLVQDETLKRADARIKELEAEFGDEPQERGLQAKMQPGAPASAAPSQAGSFLGTAAAAAAGAIGGAFLLDGIRSMMGQATAATASPVHSTAANTDLARDADHQGIDNTKSAANDKSDDDKNKPDDDDDEKDRPDDDDDD